MKQIYKYIIVFVTFIIIMTSLFVFFMNKYNENHILNKSKELLKYLYTLNEGTYMLKDGILYTTSGSLINEKYFYNGNGDIIIDKYKNVEFNINIDNKCVNKTAEGNIKLINNKCDKFKRVDVEYVKNNNSISFISNVKNLEYKISTKDDYKGNYIKEEYNDNLILKKFNQGKNYIWFKDEDGNISNVIEFEIDCLYTNNANYDENTFYCSGSTVKISGIDWIILEDNNKEVTLMKKDPIDEKLSHCFNEKSEYCYYTKDENSNYKWSNSYINYYLNNIFINTLDDDFKNKIIEKNICDENENTSCNNEICLGYTEEEIVSNNYSCSRYSYSKIKVISYEEYNKYYQMVKDPNILSGNYFAINSFVKDKGTSIEENLEFYILEDLTKKLDVKPVITIAK